MWLRRFAVSVLTLSTILASPLFASGYHYQIDVASELISNAEGNLSGMKISWLYDKPVSLLLYDSDETNPAKRNRALVRLADQIVSDLRELNYYTNLQVNGAEQQLLEVTEYELALNEDQRLKLVFFLPVSQPVSLAGKQLEIRWLDPGGAGLLLYQSADDLSIGSVTTNCQIELENFEDYGHGDLPQVARFSCQ